ncbi:hypothetical protein CLAFUW4_13862 [Fulvia fulva]|uniref:Uncharacterized protein n=1 Tax=Passalora fulva TaxID=5499 RepID=A0A9Q8UWB7_PASFU|nr:uncharacterized protein CLAFUR5_13707 [Fulvia fulva]KAK4610192.1 hypothetical protein CLAFUR4_13865 [Fulvia fulva]KAK4610959.1 hypothetical protein CLAFUR0_13869 [Fulvia fulva]UJO24833.1 hypothetical protein CLAFUR5_13707 [Fulvia fulva]WPV22034.1 hypothetical protein CLAFUW4_13862 [Fulvia fulva]WPV37016.1 hypothetical protein CLAFUW7_13870 [Fulvia fulva]
MSGIANQWYVGGMPVPHNQVVRRDDSYTPFQTCFGGSYPGSNQYPYQSFTGQGGYGASDQILYANNQLTFTPGQGFEPAGHYPR